MKPVLLFISVLLFATFAVAPAVAETKTMSAHPSSSQLKSACDKAGGTFIEQDNMGISPDTYACTTSNCDGNGGDCSVSCGPAGCTGTTPLLVSGPLTLLGILQNGDMVFRQQSQGGDEGGGDDDDDVAAPPPDDDDDVHVLL